MCDVLCASPENEKRGVKHHQLSLRLGAEAGGCEQFSYKIWFYSEVKMAKLLRLQTDDVRTRPSS